MQRIIAATSIITNAPPPMLPKVIVAIGTNGETP